MNRFNIAAVAFALVQCFLVSTALASGETHKASQDVKIEAFDGAVWSEVKQDSLASFVVKHSARGSVGTFCASAGCYLVEVEPALTGAALNASMSEDAATHQCLWVLPNGVASTQGQCFGHAYRVSLVSSNIATK